MSTVAAREQSNPAPIPAAIDHPACLFALRLLAMEGHLLFEFVAEPSPRQQHRELLCETTDWVQFINLLGCGDNQDQSARSATIGFAIAARRAGR
jgi:hypothetical protein